MKGWVICLGRKRSRKVFKRGSSWSFSYYVENVKTGLEKKYVKGGFPTKKAAQQEKKKVEAAITLGVYDDNTLTCGKYLKYYLEHVRKPTLSYNSYKSYQNCIQNYIVPLMGKNCLSGINRADIQQLYEIVATKCESILVDLKPFLNRAFNYAVKQSLMTHNPAEGIRIVRKSKRKLKAPQVLSEEQIVKLLFAAKDSHIYMDILLGISLGLRKSEVRGLKYTDIDFHSKTVCISRSLGRPVESGSLPYGIKTKQPQFTKTSSSNRILSISESVLLALVAERKKYDLNKIAYDPFFLDEDYVCCFDNGQPRCTSYYYKPLRAVAEKADLEQLTWRLIRKSHATMMFANGAKLEELSRRLGHTNIVMTADRYLDRTGRMRDAADKMQDYISCLGIIS